MRRNRDDDETPLPPHGMPPTLPSGLSELEAAEQALLPCRFCGAQEMRKWLVLHGARCKACYEAYRRQPIMKPPYAYDTEAQRKIRAGLRRPDGKTG